MINRVQFNCNLNPLDTGAFANFMKLREGVGEGTGPNSFLFEYFQNYRE